ncbi:Teichoic acids export ATP-binding protein TagH [Poriferisphaera corsica]|uniref:Teichoic acids export ATP-binding protein TagH n=1 Tax=Poriferisphaera corsica TaxID=2528020 RepID=A0A517YW41_9BACT|nr:polysaccharide ABC transporter ATP-binding protein [Poriferisphaera corsica]QDU34451.1 Teichoic acids export ATP-binding protein TagH [Poriferisphaera corsica]
MSDPVIQVNNLSKLYNRGQQSTIHKNFVDTFSNLINFRNRQKNTTNKKENQFWALDNINFSLASGECLGIIGHNGAGKSTLLKILSRITAPTQGRIEIAGRVASLLEVGTGFHPELTGRENIFLNGTVLGMTRSEVKRKLDEIIEFSGVAEALDTPVKRYSSGMRVRLAFAVAAHLDPEILIVDEVLAVGDMDFQKKCLGKMQQAYKEDRTVLFVSHNLSAVQSLCTRCIWLDNGQIRAMGDTADVIEQYLATASDRSSCDTKNNKRYYDKHGIDARITRIEPSMQHNAGFYYKQPLSFKIHIDAKSHHFNQRFRASIHDLSGGTIITNFSTPNISLTPERDNVFTLTIHEENLVPGSYKLSLSIGQGMQDQARADLDTIVDGPTFAIHPLSQNGQTLHNWSRNLGPLTHNNVSVINAYVHENKAA